jgi:hypothetical protein
MTRWEEVYFGVLIGAMMGVALFAWAVQGAPRCEPTTPTVKIGGAVLVAGCR